MILRSGERGDLKTIHGSISPMKSLWMLVPERNTILPGGDFFTSRAMKFSPITTRVVLKKIRESYRNFFSIDGAT